MRRQRREVRSKSQKKSSRRWSANRGARNSVFARNRATNVTGVGRKLGAFLKGLMS